MNKPIEDLYLATQKLIKDAYATQDNSDYIKEEVHEFVEGLKAIEKICPGIKEKYERDKAMQESFTSEQIDFICYQIGDWYMDWKDRMATGEGTNHRLGIAKEYLKLMICGE